MRKFFVFGQISANVFFHIPLCAPCGFLHPFSDFPCFPTKNRSHCFSTSLPWFAQHSLMLYVLKKNDWTISLSTCSWTYSTQIITIGCINCFLSNVRSKDGHLLSQFDIPVKGHFHSLFLRELYSQSRYNNTASYSVSFEGDCTKIHHEMCQDSRVCEN